MKQSERLAVQFDEAEQRKKDAERKHVHWSEYWMRHVGVFLTSTYSLRKN